VRFSRLSHEIFMVFVLVIVVCLGVSGWFVMQFTENIVTRKIAEGDRNLAGRIAQEIEAEMASVKPTLTLLAESTGLGFMKATEVKGEIDRVQRSFPEITSIYVADVQGEQIARTGTGKLENVSRIWSFQAARGGDELVSDIYLKPMTSEPVQTITLPIIDKGAVVGVLSADVSFRRIMVSVMGIYIGKNGNVIVVADNGRVVAHTRMKQVPELDLTRVPVVKAVLAGEKGTMKGYTDELGRQVLGSYMPISELGWGVLIQRPLADIDAEVGQIGTTIVLVTIAAVLLAVLAGWLMSRQIAKPIGQLASASKRVAQGDLSTLVDVKSSNEVGALAHSFNQMIVSLKKSRDELQQWSEELRQSEEKYRTLTENVNVGIYRTTAGPEGKFIEVNPAFVKMFGYKSRKELLSINVSDLYQDPKNREKFSDKVVREGFVREEEVQLKKKNGTPLICSESTVAVKDEKGRVQYYDGIVEDITERKRVEEELRKHREHLEELVKGRTAQLRAVNEEVRQRADELTVLYDVSHDLAATLDLETLLPVIAQRVTDTLGADRCTVFLFDERAEVLRARASRGYMAERLADFSYRPGEEIVGQAYATGETQYVPDLDVVPDLPRRDEIRAVLAMPLVSATASPLGVLSVTSLRPDAFTPDQQQLLETMAGQIAGAIENARLYEAAQEADRLKSAFLAAMSHELRTPLNSIIGFTGIMLQGLAGPLSDEQSKQLGMVQGSARHLLNLINDVLDISKIEAGQVKIVSQPFDMRQAIEKVVRTVTPLAEKKGLALLTRVAPEVDQIVSDRRRVEQILINLLDNAVKFTEKGEVRIECEVNDGWLVTQVVDTGIGIKPEDMGKLFEAFRQIETGLTRRYEGTGLGLSICKRLVEMLGGEIWVESEWGEGSTFTFTLPEEIGE